MLYPKWAICYISYKISEGLVIFLDCLTLENEGAMILQDCGNHSPSDAMSHTRRFEYSGLVLIKPAAAKYTPTG